MNYDKLLFERFFADWSGFTNEQIISILKIKCKEILSIDTLQEKLKTKKKLNIKFGIDPTAKDIHIGHVVPIMLLNVFLKTGHHVDFIIGDFTAQVGDPSGRNTERKALSDEQIAENMTTYTEQIAKYVDISKLNLHKNSEWLMKCNAKELFGVFQNINLAQSLQREDFRNRLAHGGITLAEVCYAVLMGLDSVAVKADVEVGGIDQLLNFQQCKEVMRIYGQEPEVAMAVPILEGLSGDGRKMSKSFNNYVAVNSSPDDKFGKIMSLPDNLLFQYFTSFAYLFEDEVEDLKKFIAEKPMEAKKQLATYLVAIEAKDYEKGFEERANFERKFSKNELTADDFIALKGNVNESIIEVLFASNQFASKGEIRRLIKQNAVKNLDTDTLLNEQSVLEQPAKVKVGKRLYFDITLN